MSYTELNCTVHPPELAEIVMAELADFGFEGFSENENGFSAYLKTENFDEKAFLLLDFFSNPLLTVAYSLKNIEDKNWNILWERNFDPVMINNECYIRAPFHPQNNAVKYEIIIEPKMSFGTGHHETTSMMIQLLLSEKSLQGKRLLDMGSGTAILAILAKKLGADYVMAVDNDQWAFTNAMENIQRNHTTDIDLRLGDASVLGDMKFDIILANINRNILLQDIPTYSAHLLSGGHLFLSGFYLDDLEVINNKCSQFGIKSIRYITNNRWCASVYNKI